MKKFLLSGFCLRLLAAAAFFAATPADAADLAVPLLKDLRKPVEKKVVEETDAPVIPGKVSPDRRLANPASVFPGGAVWYFAVPNAAAMRTRLETSPTGTFWTEPALAHTLRNNRFGLEFLFSDLPASVVTGERVAAISAAIELALSLGTTAEKMAMAGYIDADGRFNLMFAFDVGLDREPAFNLMANWETGFALANPGAEIERGDRGGAYVDSLILRGSSAASPAEISVGFVENIAVISTSRGLAAGGIARPGAGGSLLDSDWGQKLEASIPASGNTDVVGFVRMDALLEGLRHTPIARQAVADWADYIGYGGREGEAMYYGLQFTADGSRETLLMPTPGVAAPASLVELLAKRLRPVAKWSSPNVMPYQPNPSLFLAAQLESRNLGSLLRQERRLFGASSSESFVIPPAVRRIFTNEVLDLLTGEIGIAFYPGASGENAAPSWLMILPCRDNPAGLLPRAENTSERAGVNVMSHESAVNDSPAWAVLSPDAFRRIGGHHLVISSRGELLFSTIDQLLAGSSFASNRDFVRAVEQAESGAGMLFYVNLPEMLVRFYPEMSQVMRSLYPRSSGFNSRPPLTLLRRYAKGVLGAISPADSDALFTRLTIQAPAPALSAVALNTVLRYPSSLRAEGRAAMGKSRENLTALWLRLQLYSSRFGHFPDTLDDLLASMRGEAPMEEIRQIFTAPAALGKFTPAEAMRGSYKYLAGVTPNDEPDLPVICEAEPWSEDFSGMHPTEAARAQAETGDFQAFRQYIRLDGQVVVLPEKRFLETIMPRLTARE